MVKSKKEIKKGNDVILDYGFWTKEKRAEYYKWAKKLTAEVYFHTILCDIETARQRIIERTQNNTGELYIDENCFNKFLQQYEPLTKEENYPTVFISFQMQTEK